MSSGKLAREIDIESFEYKDLNSLFTLRLTYGFDELKTIIDLLVRTSKKHSQSIFELKRDTKSVGELMTTSKSHGIRLDELEVHGRQVERDLGSKI